MIKLIDSSIRDGGNINDWKFGKKVIDGIVKDLVCSNIDIVELGYLRNIIYSEDKSLFNTVAEASNIIPNHHGNTEFSLMVQEDKWDWNNLEPCNGSIKHIRVSFHKTDIKEGLALCAKVIEYGYVCHCNPINIMGYSDSELLRLIEEVNGVNPECFTVVDTFGSMTLDDLKRIESLLHNNLNPTMKVSAHLHENLGLAYSLAQEFISYFESKRELFVDASLYGIGRIPGNLCQELVMNYLINEKNAQYDINPIYDAIDDFIVNIKKKNPWGYALPYALSATYNLHRTYPEYLMGKGRLRTKDIKAILGAIIPSERVIYNEKYIEDLYQKYIDVNADDSITKVELQKIFVAREIMIIAPGYSITDEKEKIQSYISNNHPIVISVNFDGDYAGADYYFYTNPKRYIYDCESIQADRLIATSNLLRDSVNAKYIVSIEKLINNSGQYCEDSVVMLVKLLIVLGIPSITIAGFDGFLGNEDHFDSRLDNCFSSRYDFNMVKKNIDDCSMKIRLNFLTRSAYQND